MRDSQSKSVFSDGHRHTDARVGLEILRPAEPGMAAMIFGAESPEDYFCFTVRYTDSDEVRVFVEYVKFWASRRSWEQQELGEARFELPKQERADWLRLTIQVEGTRGTAYVGGRRLFRFKTLRPAHGMLGLFVTGNTKHKGPIGFRDLSIRPILATESSVEAIARHLNALEQESDADPRAVLQRLPEVQGRVLGIEDRTERASAAARIEKLIARLVARPEEHSKGRVAAATSLLEAANAYLERGWKRSAEVVLRDAAALSLETARSQLER